MSASTTSSLLSDTSDPTFRLRDMAAADIATALHFSEDVGWPHRLSDWRLFSSLGSGRVALVHDTVAAVGQCWTWGEHAASIGLLVAAPAFRGGDAERRLLADLMASLENRSILLYAFGDRIDLAKDAGFFQDGGIEQWQGRPRPAPLMPLPDGARLRPASRNDLAELTALDARAMGMPRAAMIAAWLEQAVSAIVLDRGSDAAGFAIMRRFGRGVYIGPVVAPDALQAQAMIAHLCSAATGRFLRLDIRSEFVSEMHPWLTALGLSCVTTVPLMRHGPVPEIDGQIRSVAIAAQTLG
jgi:hypothetical protein